MSSSLSAILLLGWALVASAGGVNSFASIRSKSLSGAKDMCSPSDTGFKEESDQAAVACYAGNFLVKALTEVNQGIEEKTAQHVHVHLLPYLGGSQGLAALLNDNIRDVSCGICFMSDYGTEHDLHKLRLSLSDAQVKDYDDLKPCYHTLTNRIMSLLPVDAAGLYLVAEKGTEGQEPADVAFGQTVALLKELFADKKYDAAGCRL